LLSNVVHISFEFQGENIQAFRRIPTAYIDLGKIDEINNFSRDFVNEKYTLDEAISLLNKISRHSQENFFKNYIAPGFAGAFFSLLFGGVFRDFISTFFITSFMCWVLSKLKKFEVSFVVSNFIGAFIVSTLAIFSIYIGIGANQDPITIGSIMVLVPGLIATNSSRDIMYEDYLSGLIGLTQAVFIAFFIALGVGSALRLFGG
ncbi:MAG: threonine/serine exporter family protein, partial [Peptoniphilus sp.]|nr:threonine/serine exporter family protein [Peptoniphilus sp.]